MSSNKNKNVSITNIHFNHRTILSHHAMSQPNPLINMDWPNSFYRTIHVDVLPRHR